jgi:hypothetical protein
MKCKRCEKNPSLGDPDGLCSFCKAFIGWMDADDRLAMIARLIETSVGRSGMAGTQTEQQQLIQKIHELATMRATA